MKKANPTCLCRVPQDTSNAHIAEIAQILARGLVRLRVRMSRLEFDYPRESSLDFVPHQSGVANTTFGDRRR